MHELAITESLIDLVAGECRKENIGSPKKIIADLGALTGYKKDSILYYYDLLRKDIPILANAELEIREIRATVSCNSCKVKSVISEPYLALCSRCGSRDINITSGREFMVKEIQH